MNYKKLSFSVGIMLLSSLLVCIPIFNEYKYLNEIDLDSLNKVSGSGSTSETMVSIGFSSKARYVTNFVKHSLAFQYPKTLEINDTKLAELTYTKQSKEISIDRILTFEEAKQILKSTSEWNHSEIGKRTIRLFSSGFDIEPSSSYVTKDDEISPMNAMWTITPKNVGNNQILILDVRELLGISKENNSLEGFTLSLNGKEFAQKENGFIGFELDVVTIWGIERKTYEILKIAISFLCFVLMFPILHDFTLRKINQET